MKHTIDANFFPGFVRKSITFTIDDGNLTLDKKFLDIVSPAGFRGTFNLCSDRNTTVTPEKLREFYRGHEISNHCKYHTDLLPKEAYSSLTDEPFDARTADKTKIYPRGVEGLYYYWNRSWWSTGGDFSHYRRYEREGRRELEKIFGKGKICGYVYPDGDQKNARLKKYLESRGYYGLRITGCVGDSTGFAFPADRTAWSYNANYTNMEEFGRRYEQAPDDGKLKFFCFGVHSHDFENAGRWDVLEHFAAAYGNRPEAFYYAPVGELFAYEDAVAMLKITEEGILNPSDIDLYLTVDGVRVTLRAGKTYSF